MSSCQCVRGLVDFLGTVPSHKRCFICRGETAPVAALMVAVVCLRRRDGLDTIYVPACMRADCARRVQELVDEFTAKDTGGSGAVLVGASRDETVSPSTWARGASATERLGAAGTELNSRIVLFSGRCYQCGIYEWKKVDSDVGMKLLTCGRCGQATYCSKECQRIAWSLHRRRCTN